MRIFNSRNGILRAALLASVGTVTGGVATRVDAGQVASQKASANTSDDRTVRDINVRFLEDWLVRGEVSSAATRFSPHVHLIQDDLNEASEIAGHKYPDWDQSDTQRVHSILALFLSDLKNLSLSGRRLDEILWTGLFRSKDTPARDAVNNVNADAFVLVRASDQRLRQFSEDVPELKNRNPDEILYVSFFFVKFKRKDDGVLFYALWRKQNSNWLIVDFGAMTD
jgi:hypothetical protein